MDKMMILSGPKTLIITDEKAKIKSPGGEEISATHTMRIKGETVVLQLAGFDDMPTLKMDSFKALQCAREFAAEGFGDGEMDVLTKNIHNFLK